MFITNGFRQGNEFWRYILGSAFIIFLTFAGIVPYQLALAAEYQETGVTVTDKNMMQYLTPNATLFYNLVPSVFALIGIAVVMPYFHWQTLRELVTGRKKVDWKRIFVAFCLWGIISGGTVILAFYLTPEDFVWNFRPVPFAIMAAISIVLLPVQTSVEEFVFRGYLMQGFALLAKNRWFPLLMTSLIFGLLHGLNPEVEKLGYFILVYYIGTGLFLGIMTLMDDGMELSLGFHAANNLVTALLVTADWTALQTDSVLKDVSEPSLSFEVFFPVVILFPLLLITFSKIYKWSGWKEKLTGKLP